jgi:hypothetical protein
MLRLSHYKKLSVTIGLYLPLSKQLPACILAFAAGWLMVCSFGCAPMGAYNKGEVGATAVRWVRKPGEVLKIPNEEIIQFRRELTERANLYIKQHPDLPQKDMFQKLAATPGMNQEQVRFLLGEPKERITTAEKLPDKVKEQWSEFDEAWLYPTQSSKFNDAIDVLYFRQGRVTHIIEYGHYFMLW